MAITVYTGAPGAGKSHALVKDLLVPGVLVGRRVVTNIAGVDPAKVLAYCEQIAAKAKTNTSLGTVLLFDGDAAKKPGFWPDDKTPDTETFIKGGDLVIFDEWKLTFPNRGPWPAGCNVEPFMRWHRHLNAPDGTATDLAIGTQLATDVHLDVRGLVAKSYKFRKLTMLGAAKTYSWGVYEGHAQPKGGAYMQGQGNYDPEIFPLYESSSAAAGGKHVELKTNKKESIWGGWKARAFVVGVPLGLVIAFWGISKSWAGLAAPTEVDVGSAASGRPAGGGVAPSAPAPVKSAWRIVGHIEGDAGTRVIVADADGATRILNPDGFQFDQGRPVRGLVDGALATSEDRIPVADQGPTAMPGIAL